MIEGFSKWDWQQKGKQLKRGKDFKPECQWMMKWWQSGRRANTGKWEGASGTRPFSYRHKTHFRILWELWMVWESSYSTRAMWIAGRSWSSAAHGIWKTMFPLKCQSGMVFHCLSPLCAPQNHSENQTNHQSRCELCFGATLMGKQKHWRQPLNPGHWCLLHTLLFSEVDYSSLIFHTWDKKRRT